MSRTKLQTEVSLEQAITFVQTRVEEWRVDNGTDHDSEIEQAVDSILSEAGDAISGDNSTLNRLRDWIRTIVEQEFK